MIGNVAHTGSPFELTQVPALPLALNPEESTEVMVTFSPDVDQTVEGTLTVTSTEPLGERSAFQSGLGVYGNEVEQVWEIAVDPPSDIVFSVDHSCSMSDDALAVANNFSTFISQLSNYSND